MASLFADPTKRIFALYGNTGDYFYTPQLRELDLCTWLVVHLKSLGYRRVVFYSPDKKVHFIDAESARLAWGESRPSGTGTGAAPSPPVTAGRSRLKAGPLGFARIQRHRPPPAAPAATAPAPPAPATQPDPVRWDFGMMGDAQAESALDRMMREDLATGLVFQNGEDFFSSLDQDAVRHWDNRIGNWTGTGLPAESRNFAVLIFRDEITLGAERLPRLRKHLFGNQEHQPLADRSFRVGPARQDEVGYLLHRLRLRGQLRWTPRQIEQHRVALAQRLIPERIGDGVKSMMTLGHEIRSLATPTVATDDPWQALRQAPGLATRVEDKLSALVKTAKERLARHGTPPEAPGAHGIARLSRPRQPNADRLANLHLALLGSPGTGKTTLARLVARIYRQEGILASGHLVEVSASDLIEEHIGGTAKRTAEAVSRALGGVLFIDEAYSLNSNQFGAESVAELVKAMTDHNGQFAVIVAGYTNEIQDFIAGPDANPGLRRRFPEDNRWELANYDPAELYQIFSHLLAKEGYQQDEALRRELPGAFVHWARSQDPERFGNAGEVSNLVASLTRQAGETRVLDKQAFADLPGWRQFLGLQSLPSVDELLRPLDTLVGLVKVREQLASLCHGLHAEMRRRGSLAGQAPGHYLFIGNAGTGKTQVARLVGAMFQRLGLLNRGHVHEVPAHELIGTHVGEAERNMREALRRAQDGVLFIDEAHQLVASGQSPGQSALQVLVPELENRRQQLCVILAGYPAEMRQLLATDQGLASRTRVIDFADYSPQELLAIAVGMLDQRQMHLTPEAAERLLRLLAFLAAQRAQGFGNARTVRELIDQELLPSLARRLSLDPSIPNGDPRLSTIGLDDIPTRTGFDPGHWDDAVSGQATTDISRVLQDLDRLTGLQQVKDAIRGLADTLAVQQRRGKGGLAAGHYVFSGNPGTGKTTVARLMGRVFRSLGLLAKGHVLEVKREDLVGRYQGDAENNTKERIEAALDGILFIDEAYQLAQDEHDIYGRRAIETLLASMENHRDRLTVILAGYPNEMQHLLNTNPGFARRFGHWIEFADYTAGELHDIALGMFKDRDYRLTDEATSALATHLQGWDRRRGRADFGNAGDVRNLVDAIVARQSARLRPLLDRVSEEDLNLIEAQDIPAP